MKQVENLIKEYHSNPSNSNFEEIYDSVLKAIIGSKDGNPYFRQVARSIKADISEVKAAFDDAVLYSISKYNGSIEFIHYFKWIWKGRRSNLYKKMKRIRLHEYYGEDSSDDTEQELFVQIPDSVTVEDTVLQTKKADQHKLIDFLVCGESERTTAIVQTFLSTDLKSPTAIGKYLGLDHKQVTRALEKLASKFDKKQFGSYTDYLVAQ